MRILDDAEIETPALTARVLAVGNIVAGHWLALIFAGAVLIPTCWITLRRAAAHDGKLARAIDRIRPAFLRRNRVGALSTSLAELLRTGVPLTESLQVLAPTTGPRLGRTLDQARAKVERGTPIAEAFQDDAWFDAEFLRLLDLGHATGELPALLERIGDRYRRSAERALDRYAALVEPAAILVLAALVGTVALAAVLPLFKLQEVLQ